MNQHYFSFFEIPDFIVKKKYSSELVQQLGKQVQPELSGGEFEVSTFYEPGDAKFAKFTQSSVKEDVNKLLPAIGRP